jgi:2,3-dihydroxybenzoate-AMP ligase
VIPARQEWPAEFATRYRERGYWIGETLGGFVRDRAAAHPSRVAIVAGDTRWSYAELDARADALGAAFLALGLRPGDRVIVQLPNVPEFVSLVIGLFRCGVLPVFALPAHRRSEIVHLARASEAVAYVAADVCGGFDYRVLAREIRADVPAIRHVVIAGEPGPFIRFRDLEATPAIPLSGPSPSDVAFLQLSGGSTGLPKLIPRTHDDYAYSLRGSADICGLGPDSVYLVALPIAHNYPMSSPGFLGTLYAGGTVVLAPAPSPDVVFPIVARERVTITGVVPPIALIWMQAAASAGDDLSSLRVLQVGGAKLTPEAARRLRAAFPRTTLQQVFGMAEGLVNYTRLDDLEETIVHTQGRPISPDDEVRILDDAGRDVAPGTAGHLLTRGPYTIRAYHNAPAANAAAFTADGFYRTGDIVIRRRDGNLVVQGRANDMINRGGEKISAEEVEDHLLAHDRVHDAVVVSVPDPFLGERACAFVIARAPVPRAVDLKAWLRSRGLAAFKVPDHVVFVDAFPATGVGKISRRDLRAALQRQWAERRAVAPEV